MYRIPSLVQNDSPYVTMAESSFRQDGEAAGEGNATGDLVDLVSRGGGAQKLGKTTYKW